MKIKANIQNLKDVNCTRETEKDGLIFSQKNIWGEDNKFYFLEDYRLLSALILVNLFVIFL